MEQAQLALILVMHSDVNAKCVGLLQLFQRHSGLHDDVTCMYDDVTCMHDDVTCMYDDVTIVSMLSSSFCTRYVCVCISIHVCQVSVYIYT